MELKSLEDWVVEKNFKAVPDIVDVSSFGGPTREYQVRLDPNKLIAYGLSLAQVEQQLTNNNVNAGGSFIESGLQQINIREVGLVRNVQDIENTVLTTKNGTPLRVRDIAVVAQGPKIRLGQFARAIHREDGKIIDNDDVVSGIVLLRKGADADEALAGIHAKVKELNDHILPPGVKIVPFIDRSDLVHFTTHTVLHNLTEGMVLVVIVLFLFLGNVRGAIIVALDDSVFPAVRGDLSEPEGYSGQSAFAWRAGFRHGGGRRGGDGREHRASHGARQNGNEVKAGAGGDSRSRARSAAAGVLRHRHHHHRLSAHIHAAARGGAVVQAHGLDGSVRAAGRACCFPCWWRRCFRASCFQRAVREWHNPVLSFLTNRYRKAVRWAIEHRWMTLGVAVAGLVLAAFLTFGGVIGSEFLPHLDEGALWVRGTLAPSTGPSEGIRVANQARIVLCSFPGSPAMHQPGGTAGRWHRYHRIFQHGIFRRPEAQGTVAACFSPE